ncbi:MAG: SPFH domain-containing protein [Thiobacillus sp.]|jgi:regulator of protease activity HflC (stomatin/prohibitin superfamily)
MDVVAFVILIVIAIVVAKGVCVVPQQNAWVVERLGKFHAVLGHGLNLVIPFIDTVAYKHSLKEIPLDVPSQICITRDNTQLAVDGILYFQVTSRSPTPRWRLTARATTSMPSRSWRRPLCAR